jgi:hypothetical protein
MTTVASGFVQVALGEQGVAMRSTPGSGFCAPIRLIFDPPVYWTVQAHI